MRRCRMGRAAPLCVARFKRWLARAYVDLDLEWFQQFTTTTIYSIFFLRAHYSPPSDVRVLCFCSGESAGSSVNLEFHLLGGNTMLDLLVLLVLVAMANAGSRARVQGGRADAASFCDVQ